MNIHWKKKTQKIRQKFAVISAKDLIFKEGKEELMVKKLSDKLGKTDEEILSLLIEF
jgi:hypothetical protein